MNDGSFKLMRTLYKFLGSLLLLVVTLPLHAQNTDEILQRMMARNDWQHKALLEFRARRKFYAANLRFKTGSTLYVETTFKQPDQVQSVVTAHQGSSFIRSRVFDKILEAEEETHAKKD